MNNPFDYTPHPDCARAFAELCARIEKLKQSEASDDMRFCRELEAGKMLGVLIALDAGGNRHTLFAFSGQLGASGFRREGFVGPVFDYLQPEGYFKRNEADISRRNELICQFERVQLAEIRERFKREKERFDAEIAQYKEHCRKSRLARAARRDLGDCDAAEAAAMIRQSQFEKAELHRLKKRTAAALLPLENELDDALATLSAMKEERKRDSEALQKWLFDNFMVLNARGEGKSLSEIFAETPFGIPPSGAGECCAPKLLHAAYLNHLHPMAIAEYWYGRAREGEVRRHGEAYPACRGKCGPVLRWMLQGLEVYPALEGAEILPPVFEPEIIFENEWFCVVNKPSGMLSVPGKGMAMSVQRWLEQRYGDSRQVKVAHRLDQDTSGILIAAFGQLSFKTLQSLFATRQVSKTYEALLEGDWQELGLPCQGRISLPLSPDWLDRPRQRVDPTDGKEAATDYEFIAAADGRSRIIFHPLTGRTHQLRVHAASPSGLDMPIAGDRLYGPNRGQDAPRLMLHAHDIEFRFPLDDQNYRFSAPTPF